MKFPGVWFGFDSVKRKNGCVLKHTVRNAVLFIRFINDSLPSKIFPRSNHNSIEKLISKKRGYHLYKNETCTKIISEVTLKKITRDIWRCLLIAHGS